MASLKARLERLKNLGLGLEPASALGQTRLGEFLPSSDDAEVSSSDRVSASERFHENECPARIDVQESGYFLPGWEKLAPHVFMKISETNFDVSMHWISTRIFQPYRLAHEPSPDISIRDISFFDLETTGLSGGSGTIAFLAGIGWFAGSDFIIAQVFIDDFPGEADALDQIIELLSERPWICSYNGKAFDVPLLQTRCIMNGVRFSASAGHLDALTASRRLWKRTVGSCALADIEVAILGHSREADVPGAEIPKLWLDYSKMKSLGQVGAEMLDMMDLVCLHNKTDILSLARLVLYIQRLYENPIRYLVLPGTGFSVDINRFARHCIALGRIDGGLALLEESAAQGNEEALLLLVHYYKSRHDRQNQARVLSALGTEQYSACIEKAKFAEHVEKDYEKAFSLAAKAARIAEANHMAVIHQEKCQKRIQRITGKMRSQ